MSDERDPVRVVEMDLGEQWVAEMEWPDGVTSGGPGVLVIRPSDPDSYPHGGISHTVLRDVDFREGVEILRRQLSHGQRRAELREISDRRLRKELTEGGVTDLYLAMLSSRYVRITNNGQRHPQETLAKAIHKTASTVKGHLWQARKRDLLDGSAGRAGGVLTGKASALLRQALDDTLDSPDVRNVQ